MDDHSYEITKMYQKCQECDQLVSNTRPWNFTSHMKNKHKAIFDEHIDIEIEQRPEIEVKRLKLLQNCAKMLVFTNANFQTIRSTAFHDVIEDTMTLLQKHNRPLDLTSFKLTEVKEYIFALEKKVTADITANLKNKPIALMIDLMTRHGRKFLAISVQCAGNKDIVSYTLSVAEFGDHLSHSRQNIKDAIQECLDKHCIESYTITSCTSDNGLNVISLIQKFTFDFDPNESDVEDNEVHPSTPEPVDDTEENDDIIDLESSEAVDEVI